MHKQLALAVAFTSIVASGAEPGSWQSVSVGSVTVKSREVPGSPVKEFWAETDLNAEVQDLQSTLLDAERFREFMPFVKESRFVANVEADGSRYAYVKLALPPPMAARDYVVRVKTIKSVAPDGSGEFENRWEAVPDKLPKRAHTIRLRVNEGSWQITPLGDGRSHVVYKFRVDPSGMVPGFAAEMANKSGIPDTLKAAEKEAQKRGAARKAKQAAQPAPVPTEAPDAGTK